MRKIQYKIWEKTLHVPEFKIKSEKEKLEEKKKRERELVKASSISQCSSRERYKKYERGGN